MGDLFPKLSKNVSYEITIDVCFTLFNILTKVKAIYYTDKCTIKDIKTDIGRERQGSFGYQYNSANEVLVL